METAPYLHDISVLSDVTQTRVGDAGLDLTWEGEVRRGGLRPNVIFTEKPKPEAHSARITTDASYL
jgi:hypothetical protein